MPRTALTVAHHQLASHPTVLPPPPLSSHPEHRLLPCRQPASPPAAISPPPLSPSPCLPLPALGRLPQPQRSLCCHREGPAAPRPHVPCAAHSLPLLSSLHPHHLWPSSLASGSSSCSPAAAVAAPAASPSLPPPASPCLASSFHLPLLHTHCHLSRRPHAHLSPSQQELRKERLHLQAHPLGIHHSHSPMPPRLSSHVHLYLQLHLQLHLH